MTDRYSAKVTRAWQRSAKRIVQADVYVDGLRIGNAIVQSCCEKNDYEPDGDDWCSGKLHRLLAMISSGVNRYAEVWRVVDAIEAAIVVYDEPVQHVGAFVSTTHSFDYCRRSHRNTPPHRDDCRCSRCYAVRVSSCRAVRFSMDANGWSLSALTLGERCPWRARFESGDYQGFAFYDGGEQTCIGGAL